MPGGKRTDRISERDLEVLEFVARFGVVPREVVAMWAGTGRAVAAARERRLRETGLVEVLPGVGDSGKLVLCTRTGLRAVFRTELPVPRFSPATVQHAATTARVAVGLERAGRRVLSEREISARERAESERIFSIPITAKRFHRPDLICLSEQIEAVEVELTTKATGRLDGILGAWHRAVVCGQFDRVRYLCSSQTLPPVQRSMERTAASAAIQLEPLDCV
jgi:hypothetical protein